MDQTHALQRVCVNFHHLGPIRSVMAASVLALLLGVTYASTQSDNKVINEGVLLLPLLTAVFHKCLDESMNSMQPLGYK